MESIADRIKDGMRIRNLKQADIVERTGINKGALSSYLSGKYEPKRENISKIAKVLDVNEAWLLGGDIPMKRYDNYIEDYKEETILQSYLKILGWTYEYLIPIDGLNCKECSRTTEEPEWVTGISNTKPLCEHCKKADAYYIFSNGNVSFNVSKNDFQSLISSIRFFTKEQIQSLFKKSTKNLFNEGTDL